MISKPRLGVRIDWGHPLAKGISAFWLMNENAGSLVSDIAGVSGNQKHGTSSGSVLWKPGMCGSALEFDASEDVTLQYVSASATGLLSGWSACTVVAWAKAVTDVDTYARIFTNSSSNVMLYHRSNTSAGFYVDASGGDAVAAVNAAMNAWHQYVGTYDGAQACFYLNGLLRATDATISGTIDDVGANILIGGDDVATNQTWNGLIDYVLLYNRALTSGEIYRLYFNRFSFMEIDEIDLWTAASPAAAGASMAGHYYRHFLAGAA